MSEMKKCTGCEEVKPATLEFYYKGKIQLRAKCKRCCSKEVVNNPNHNIRNIQYYYDNKDKRNKYDMIYYIKHKTGAELCY
jgi:hypothetical protein